MSKDVKNGLENRQTMQEINDVMELHALFYGIFLICQDQSVQGWLAIPTFVSKWSIILTDS